MTSYAGIHWKLGRYRGRAEDYPCETGCGAQASDWAYMHTGTTLVSQVGRTTGRLYSADITDYSPLCRSCHVKLDHQHDPDWAETLRVNMTVQGCRENRDLGGCSRGGKAGGAKLAARLKNDPEFAVAHALRAAQNVKAAHAAVKTFSPDRIKVIRAAQSAGALRGGAVGKRRCAECGKVSTRAGIGTHQARGTHTGWEDVADV